MARSATESQFNSKLSELKKFEQNFQSQNNDSKTEELGSRIISQTIQRIGEVARDIDNVITQENKRSEIVKLLRNCAQIAQRVNPNYAHPASEYQFGRMMMDYEKTPMRDIVNFTQQIKLRINK